MQDLTLTLVQTKIGERIYELKNDLHTIASLQFLKNDGTGAELHIAQQNFVLKRKGFWKPYIVITEKHTDTIIAKVPFSLDEISFETAAGHEKYYLNNTSFWKGEWQWVDAEQNVLIAYSPKNTALSKGTCIVNAEIEKVNQWELLCMLGWYMLVCMEEEMDSATVVLTSVA